MQEKNEQEVWKDVVGYRNLYKVSNLGRVKRLARSYVNSIGKKINLKEKVLKPNPIKGGYYQLKLTKDKVEKNILLHRIVCEAFNGPAPKGKDYVNHKDCNKENNHETNLEWCSFQENMDHAAANGLRPRGSGNSNHKLKEEEVLEICDLLDTSNLDMDEISQMYGVNHRSISNINVGVSWKWLTGRDDSNRRRVPKPK